MTDDRPTSSESMTAFIKGWLDGMRGDDGEFLVARYGAEEARQAAIAPASLLQAAEALEGWFVDRLTVDPGVTGPFGGLACNLLTTALEEVDWLNIALLIRNE